jgi:hypothetical protein
MGESTYKKIWGKEIYTNGHYHENTRRNEIRVHSLPAGAMTEPVDIKFGTAFGGFLFSGLIGV